MKKKRFIALVLAILLLFGSQNALAASGAGTSSDPLISLQYIEDTFIPAVLSAGRALLQSALAAIGLDGSQRSTSKVLAAGTVLTINTGASLTIVSGAATLKVTKGTVLDLTNGKEVSAGAMDTEVRYFAAEKTKAVITLTQVSKVIYEGNVSKNTSALQQRFSDVKKNNWAYPYIMQLADDGYVKGVGDGLFGASSNMTRRDFVTILGRIAGVKVSNYKSQVFTDIDPNTYYGPYVAWAEANGIVKGYGNGRFGGTDLITRSQMAVIIKRYAAYTGEKLTASSMSVKFADDALIESWARSAVYAARDAGLITGKTGNLFDPQASATRAEVSTVLCRLIYGV